MDLGLSGKTAAVAAASTGLGLASARALVGEGVRVAICGRREDRLAKAAEKIGAPVETIVADVSEPDGARGFVETAQERLGSVDILVANAGGPPGGTFASTELSAYEEALRLNLLSTIEMCQASVPAMQERGWGRIVAITSVGARQPITRLIASSTARAGATGFLKALALSVAADGVTVNSVQPGMHATERLEHLGTPMDELAKGIPVGFVGDPDDFGAIVTFLCSAQARFITGSAIPIEGGAYPGLQ